MTATVGFGSMGRFATACAVVTAVIVAFGAVLITDPLSAGFTLAVNDIAQALGAFAAAVACAMAGRRRQQRRPWWLLAAATASWGIGEVMWTVYEVGFGREAPFPSAADVGFLAMIPLAAAALVAFPSGAASAVHRLRLVLDGMIVAGSLLFVSWALVLGQVWSDDSQARFTQIVALAYPVGDVVILTMVVVVLSRTTRSGRAPLVLVGLGLSAIAIADSAFAYLTNQASYGGTDITDLGWFAGFLVIALAALHPRGGESSSSQAPAETKAWVLLPYLPLTMTGVVAIIHIAMGEPLGEFLSWLLAAVVAVVVLRQLLALLDNLRLADRQQLLLAELAEREEQLRRLALYDALTGLPNRVLFWERAEHALERAAREHRAVGVLYVDLDGFKSVNDDLGHHAGDRVLALVAERLRDSVRAADTIARLAGDEFAVLVEDADDETTAEVARRVLDALDQPFEVDGTTVRVTCSVGAAVGANRTIIELLQQADAAMYVAKRNGKAQLLFHPPAPSTA